MDIKIEGNPGTGNTFQEIHIGSVGTYNNADVIYNYYGTSREQYREKKKQEGVEDDTPDDPNHSTPDNRRLERLKESEEIDRSTIRTEILNYVSRVRPLVHPDKRDRYMKMWEGILELDAVRPFVYKTGKQKRTNFNRKLIVNILHHLDTRRMYKDPYKARDLALALESNYDMSVRGELGKYPSEHVCAEINEYLETLGL